MENIQWLNGYLFGYWLFCLYQLVGSWALFMEKRRQNRAIKRVYRIGRIIYGPD
jgi:hypothetical protein